MKRIIVILFLSLLLFKSSVRATLPLTGKLIAIDIGHGGLDIGSSYQNIYEKDINLAIGKKLEKVLSRNGASVIMIRDGDYDLASPNAKRRKKSDFDNRIKLINESNANLYLSIHTNYLSDNSYYGAQVFYDKDNMKLANYIQARLNTITYPRSIKKMPNIYMYQHLNINGVLIEVGFISNNYERNKLINDSYQNEIAKLICYGVIDFFK